MLTNLNSVTKSARQCNIKSFACYYQVLIDKHFTLKQISVLRSCLFNSIAGFILIVRYANESYFNCSVLAAQLWRMKLSLQSKQKTCPFCMYRLPITYGRYLSLQPETLYSGFFFPIFFPSILIMYCFALLHLFSHTNTVCNIYLCL